MSLALLPAPCLGSTQGRGIPWMSPSAHPCSHLAMLGPSPPSPPSRCPSSSSSSFPTPWLLMKSYMEYHAPTFIPSRHSSTASASLPLPQARGYLRDRTSTSLSISSSTGTGVGARVLAVASTGVYSSPTEDPGTPQGYQTEEPGRPESEVVPVERDGTPTAAGSGRAGSRKSVPESRFWEWKQNIRVHYTVAGDPHDRSRPAVLLLPGFGVGTFHWEHQLDTTRAEVGSGATDQGITGEGRGGAGAVGRGAGLAADHRVWALDFLGQGQSWPCANPTVSSSPSANNENNTKISNSVAPTAAAAGADGGRHPGSCDRQDPHPNPGSGDPDAVAIAAGAAIAASMEGGQEGEEADLGELGKEENWGFGTKAHDWAKDLVYSADTWKLQVEEFIREVVKEPVFIVGNSLGGYVGAYVAAENPELVQGLALLNATPFWAFSPHPNRSPLLARLWPWGGMLPAPGLVRTAVGAWWNALRSPSTIRLLLRMVYAQKSAVDERLVANIMEPTAHPAAASAFASIVFAPKALSNFDDNLKRLREHDVSVCLVYGREDPWVVPLWGYRLKRALPFALYYELSPCGHCPHHEAPQEVNELLRGWLAYVSSATPLAAPLVVGLQEGEKPVETFQTSSLGPLKATEWHSFDPVHGFKELSPANTDSTSQEVKVRLIHAPPSTPISFVQAALDTVLSTISNAR